MNTAKFTNLIQLVTGRDFQIKTNDTELKHATKYEVFRILPLTNYWVSFTWKTPLSDEKMLRSFITAFTSKYREPDPAAYTCRAPYFSPAWADMEPMKREYAYMHHASNMFHKSELLKQVESNFSQQGMTEGLIKYGFYSTEYGVGIFCFWATESVVSAIEAMKKFLADRNIPFTNEFSDARWVYRFKLGISKDAHTQLLTNLSM